MWEAFNVNYRKGQRFRSGLIKSKQEPHLRAASQSLSLPCVADTDVLQKQMLEAMRPLGIFRNLEKGNDTCMSLERETNFFFNVRTLYCMHVTTIKNFKIKNQVTNTWNRISFNVLEHIKDPQVCRNYQQHTRKKDFAFKCKCYCSRILRSRAAQWEVPAWSCSQAQCTAECFTWEGWRPPSFPKAAFRSRDPISHSATVDGWPLALWGNFAIKCLRRIQCFWQNPKMPFCSSSLF